MARNSTWGGARAVQFLVLAGAVVFGLGAHARADQLQNAAVSGTLAALQAAGFGNLTGAGVNVGQVEAGGGLANSSYPGSTNIAPGNLPGGNPDLPSTHVNLFQLPGGPGGKNPLPGILPPGAGTNPTLLPVIPLDPLKRRLVVSNHATEVAGVIVGQGTTSPADRGIAVGAVVQEGGAIRANSTDNAIQQAITANKATIVNMSFGFDRGTKNNGTFNTSQFVDWAAGHLNAPKGPNAPGGVLMVVAGNEGYNGSPSDAHNVLNVGATGVRTNGDATLSYDQASDYNTPNRTADGRIGVELVAPGGDPGPTTGTARPLQFDNQFQTTAGGVLSKSRNDTYNGQGNTTASAYRLVAGVPTPRTIAGTSFAAPLVAGAGALLTQYGTINGNNPNFAKNAPDALDHRVLEAILMNGASKVNVDGTPLLNANGVQWQRAGAVTKGTLTKTLPADLGGITVKVQPGLDPQLGTGQLNVANSLINYAAGEQKQGNVKPIGWDFNDTSFKTGTAAYANTNRYTFTTGGGPFQATLAWDFPININNPDANGNWQQTSTFTPGTLTDLDLYLFSVNPNGTLGANVGFSTSIVDNFEHIYIPSLLPGTYQIDVVAASNVATDTPYGLAWAAVPEPSTGLLFGLGIVVPAGLAWRRRRRNEKVSLRHASAVWLGVGILLTTATGVRAEPIAVRIDVESLQLPKEMRQDVDEVDQAVKSFQRGDAEQALTFLRAASRKYTNLPPSRLLLARLYLARQQLGPARASLEQAAVESPDYPEIYVMFGGLALYEGRLTDAWLHYEKAEALVGKVKLADSQKAAVQKGLYAGRAAVATRRQDWPRAEAALSAWLALDAGNGQARQLLGLALFHQAKRDEARTALEQAAKDDPALGPAAMTLGQLYTEEGNLRSAAEWMERAVQEAPRDVRAHLGYARWLMEQNQPEKARTHAEIAAKLDANSSEAKALRGRICWHLHEYEAAEPIFQALHDESPGNYEFRNYLALSLAEQSKPKQQRALELAEINTRLYPNSPEALATLGRVYDRMGRPADAEYALRTAAAKGTVSADAVYWLARVLFAQGQGEDAGKMLKLALDAKGAFANRKEAATLLDQISKKP